MAYNELLADRVRQSLSERKIRFREIKMMGGLCSKIGCREMDFTGRPMKGFLFVDPQGTDLDEDLDYWIELCLDYNPNAGTSKKS